MIGEDRAWREEAGRRHLGAMAAGGGVSLVFHIGLVLLLSGMQFALPYSVQDEPWVQRRPVEVLDIKREPPDQSAATSKTLPEGEPLMRPDLPKEAEVLGVPPDKVSIEPPAVTEDRLAGERGTIAEPSAVPVRERWEPRQEVVMIENQVVADKVGPLGRRPIPRVDRVKNAPDVVLPIDRSKIDKADTRGLADLAGDKLFHADVNRKVTGGGIGGGKEPALFVGARRLRDLRDVSKDLFGTGEDGTGTNAATFKPIERYLTAELATYTSFGESKYGYFRLEIKRIGEEILPIIPKDIVLVQDCSASIAESRMHFCRDALIRCLDDIRPRDRFNVVRFRDKAEFCFKEWAENKPEAIEEAKRFIGDLKAQGNTDIFSTIKDLINVKPTPGRPVVGIMVTDGRATAGLTRSSDIIGEFTKLNEGAISIFSLGTHQTANAYLLDLLSYCNRGDSFVVTSGRWDIPQSIQNLMKEVARPVLSEVRFAFSGGGADCEVYPVLTSNLYLDRPLVLYGRYNREMKNVIFQAVGKAGDVNCDMMFDLPLEKAKEGDRTIRQDWAKQKVYHLMGKTARHPSAATLKEIEDTAKAYRVKIPHKGEF